MDAPCLVQNRQKAKRWMTTTVAVSVYGLRIICASWMTSFGNMGLTPKQNTMKVAPAQHEMAPVFDSANVGNRP